MNKQNMEAVGWQIVLKVCDDKAPRHFQYKDEDNMLYEEGVEEGLDIPSFRGSIEPWLTALFQTEHLNLLGV